MDIRAVLEADHSKPQMLSIAEYIGDQQERFDQLIHIFLHDEPVITQRAAWAVNHCCDQHPQLIDKHVVTLWKNLEKPQHSAIRRNTLRIFTTYPLPPEVEGMAATLCFDYLADPNEKIAVRAHSILILYQLSKKEPDLIPELILLLEEIMPHASAGIRSRARKVLKAIRPKTR